MEEYIISDRQQVMQTNTTFCFKTERETRTHPLGYKNYLPTTNYFQNREM